MQEVIDKLKEIECDEVGMIIYSTKKENKISVYNSDITVPLASAAKIAVGFCIAKWVEEKLFGWDDIVGDISFNPDEDSKLIYPHFQHRKTLPLRDAVEVMIACHDSFVANRIVQMCGGWKRVNKTIQSYFTDINILQDPFDTDNKGNLTQISELMILIFEGYKNNPELWTPIMNGLVRQQGDIEGIPNHYLNHMTGGLENVIVNIGILGDFNQNPLVYVFGANHLPNRYNNQFADEIINDAIKMLYKKHLHHK
ncbi:serine hydrolase [Pseudalkalibacillus salsuginis]|uniref:serine hydrolase n=1 Tax=Pseudalkalibacillus salsuginis TaxID=2910972 RepID=UPI001F279791|nr:serine hydrolase [Pseudalkalibacillus salsuginis]MCF6409537.1 class A beta-lactamase-related serine hydrolase [Pseudalkalibacillus salsuginis]